MPMKATKSLLASLVSILPLTLLAPFSAQAEVVQQPHIVYSDGIGLNFSAVTSSISGLQSPKFQWFINGKAFSGATKTVFKATAKQKNQSIQLKVTSAGTTASSVIAKIGQVIVNVNPSVSFVDTTSNNVVVTAGSVSPKSAKVTYQWYKGPIDIPGAKFASYKPTTADQGFKIYVNAKYSLKGFIDNTVDSAGLAIPVVPRVYKQLWEEEFVGAAGSLPNAQVWTSQDGDGSGTAAGGGWGNRERQTYIPSLATITDQGALRILATRTGADKYTCYYKGACEWVSGKYITKDKVTFKYGRFEARIKGPVGAGTWGAFWMLGADIDDRPWPWCGEIDVTELVGKDPLKNYGYFHGLLAGGFGGRGTTVDMPNGFASEYHTYAVDWLPDQVDWYLDGVLFGSQPKVDKDWVFDHPFYLIVNLAMGGNLGGPINPALNQASMDFDWIRFSSINGVGEVFKN